MFRQGVSIMITNNNGQVMLFKRSDNDSKFLQCSHGGVEGKENIEDAMKRELQEETGITSIEILKKMNKKIRYIFPEEIKKKLKVNRNWEFEGQEDVWFLVKFIGDESEIRFETHPEEIEFCDYKWVEPKDVVKNIVDWKKECYKKVMKEFFNV